MSNAVLNREKRKKPFKIADLIVYGIILALIVTLFLIIYLPRKNGEFELDIFLNDSLICKFSFDGGAVFYNGGETIIKTETVNNGYRLIVESEKGYNTLFINTKEKTARIIHADCSISHDCTYMEIKKSGDTIVCAPHKLFIAASGKTPPPLISG